MFRPGKPKDQPGEPEVQPPAAPQPQYGGAAANANEDTQQRHRAGESNPSTGVRGSMNDGQPNTGKAYTETDALARDIKEGNLSGFVGNGTTLTGEANFKGMLRVDGTLSGRVSSQDGTLIVSTGGQVDANVEVSVAQIYGTVNGDVTATKRIELGRVARVTGNIQTPALIIEQGAIFEGSCRMAQQRDAQAKDEARATTGAGAAATTATTPAGGGAGGTGGNGGVKTDAKPAGDAASTASATGAGGAGTAGGGATGAGATGAPKTSSTIS
ncbi:MAG: polymer-forming cytoskeletal protein [Acidobacteria bacterium]|nr:polymer-forming cytoskeletal protein [Acidobacteriota bacterium]